MKKYIWREDGKGKQEKKPSNNPSLPPERQHVHTREILIHQWNTQ